MSNEIVPTVNINTEIVPEKFTEIIQSVMDEAQWQILCGRTPKKYIRRRPGKGGQTFSYVPHGYVVSVLNRAFGLDWDWEITPQHEGKMFVFLEPMGDMKNGSVIVHGKLTVRVRNPKDASQVIATIVKTSTGEKEVVKAMTWGSMIKSAESEAFKKAASRLGVALDLYWQDADEDYLDEQVEKGRESVDNLRVQGLTDEQIAQKLDQDGVARNVIARMLGVKMPQVIRWCKNGSVH